MTGWRVGYCAAPPAAAKLVKTLQTHSSTCIPGFIEDASIVALDAGPNLMTEKIALLKSRRDLAVKELQKIENIKLVPPQGAFYAYIDIRNIIKEKGMTSLQFSERLLENQHVAMVPGEGFGTEGFLRLSYAVNNNDLIEGINRLKQELSDV